MAFFTGGHNSMSAIATEEPGAWILQRKDFDDLLTVLPVLAKQFKQFLQQQEVLLYLKERQNISDNSEIKWLKKALKNLHTGKMIMSVSKMNFDISDHKSVPLGAG